VEICRYANIEVAGIDILEDLDGNLYFMEINTSAQWEGLELATGVDVSKIFIDECLRKYNLWLEDNKDESIFCLI
jgi:glutathione synthase/RimK-type ligase-like ATP-grasp enzyme